MNIIESTLDYIIQHPDVMLQRTCEHLQMVFFTMIISIFIATILIVVTQCFKFLEAILDVILNILFSLPTIAMFAFMIPLLGIGGPTAIATLVIYNQYQLYKTINVGLASINPLIIEAAEGMGMNGREIFIKVKLPLALPSVMCGIRLSMLATVGGAVLGVLISAGGLGALIYDGFQRKYIEETIVGTLICILLCVISNEVFQYAEKIAQKKADGNFVLKKNIRRCNEE